jgi:hypothetical protein
MICPVCHIEFVPTRSTQYCCGKLCSNKYRYEQNKKNPEWIEEKRKKDRDRIRQICKTDEYRIKNKESHRKLRSSNPEKYKPSAVSCRVYFNVCSETGELFTAKRNDTKYSENGKAIRASRYAHDEYMANRDEISIKSKIRVMGERRHRKCKLCGKEYDFVFEGSPSFCSKECKNKASNKAKSYYGRNGRKRARYYGVEYEYINAKKIFIRDKWTCQLCGCKTPERLKGTLRDNAPELDHIIPLSKGGGHVKHNVQCTCRKCNNSKGNKLIGQLKISI